MVIDNESRIVVTRSWGEGRMRRLCLMGRVLIMQGEKISGY
jgi:hypothetical protein